MNKKNIRISYFEEKIETMPYEDLNILMLERLKKTLKYVYQNVPFYKEKFDDAGVNANIDLIKNMKDLQNFPFTFKSDLVNNYPFGLFSSPLNNIVRIHASSGTTAKPIIASYTKKDLKVWADLMSRVFYACGLNKNDIAQNAYGYGLFTGGLGFHYGAENIGMTIVPMSSGFTERQFAMIKDIGVTALFCTPSYALFLSEELPKYIEDVSKLKLKKGIFGAEPWSNELRIKIENLLNIDAYDIYGLSELLGPGVAFECEYKSGLHINEDNFYPEIIDPKTGDILPEGELGELVLTNLNQEAMPLIRYRTRDITSLNREKCKCGRTFVRMKKIKGRTDDMIIIKGVNIFPSQIESVIFDFDFLEPVYMIELYTDNLLDRINILIETKAEVYNMGDKKLDEIASMLQYKIHELIGIKSKVTIVPPKTLERSQGKSKRVKDLRKKL
jgi:phenylacetate-CoA ligase